MTKAKGITKEVKLTINNRPKTFDISIPTNIKIDTVIGALLLMADLLDFMRKNKPTAEMHEYHFPDGYFNDLDLEFDFSEAASVWWQSSFKYKRRGNGESCGSLLLTGSGYTKTDGENRDNWVTTMFSNSINEFLDGHIDIEGAFIMSHEEIAKWLENQEIIGRRLKMENYADPPDIPEGFIPEMKKK